MTVPHSLAELEAEFITDKPERHIGRGATLAEADGLMFLCPLCFTKNQGAKGTHRVICWFKGRVPNELEPGPGRWTPTGNGIADLSLVPSVQLLGGGSAQLLGGGCIWHGFVTNGSAA